MAPEQFRGERVTEHADQFSLAVVAYEAAYGKRPFDGKTILALAEQASSGPGGAPASKAPSALFPVIARGLSPRASDRHESVTAFLDALEAVVQPAKRRWPLVVVVAILAAAAAIFAYRRATETVHGHLSKEDVQRVVQKNNPALNACFEEAMERDQTLQNGIVKIRFFINREGRVRRTEVDDSDAPSAELANCVAAETLRWTFPAPEGGPVEVAYPFVFGRK